LLELTLLERGGRGTIGLAFGFSGGSLCGLLSR
jgi:hypothetical protein